jgi:hypothetical protein
MISNGTFKMAVCDYNEIIEETSAKWGNRYDDQDWAATEAWLRALSTYARRAAEVGMDGDAFHAAIWRAKNLFESFFEATDPFEHPKRMIMWQHQTLNLFEPYDTEIQAFTSSMMLTRSSRGRFWRSCSSGPLGGERKSRA